MKLSFTFKLIASIITAFSTVFFFNMVGNFNPNIYLDAFLFFVLVVLIFSELSKPIGIDKVTSLPKKEYKNSFKK